MKGLGHAANAAASTLHWNVPASVDVNLNVSVLTACSAPWPGPDVGSSVAVGARVSTVKLATAGSTLESPLCFPTTVNVCAPSPRSAPGVNGDVQAFAVPVSTWQVNVVPTLVNATGGRLLLVNAGGFEVKLTATISTKVRTGSQLNELSLFGRDRHRARGIGRRGSRQDQTKARTTIPLNIPVPPRPK